MKEEKKIIPKKNVELLIKAIEKAETGSSGTTLSDEGADLGKVKEIVAALEGCTVLTVVTALATVIPFLPTSCLDALFGVIAMEPKRRKIGMLADMEDDEE